MALVVRADEPWVQVRTIQGAPPPELRGVAGAEDRGADLFVPLRAAASEALVAALGRPRIEADVRLRRCALELSRAHGEPPRAVMTADRGRSAFVLEALWDGRVIDVALGISGAEHRTRWEPVDAMTVAQAVVPATAWREVAQLSELHDVAIDRSARELLAEAHRAHAQRDDLVTLSRGREGAIAVPGLAEGLLPFQAVAVQYAVRQRRIFLADEHGLGKTVQALATLAAADAFPAIVASPASLQSSWLRASQRWLPDRRAARSPLNGADIIVVGYNDLARQAEPLLDLQPRALIVDESHLCRNPRTQRTQGVVTFCERLTTDAIRLALTGTPVINGPADLMAQLRILGQMDEFNSRWFHGAGPPNVSLETELRARCFVRRRKADVLRQLPAKRHVVVPLELANAEAYALAERDVVAWLRQRHTRDGEGRLDPARRAYALVRLNALRRLVSEGKLAASLDWINSFMRSGERLVVFAHHRRIQHAVLAAYPDAARVVAWDSPAVRDAQNERFQRPNGPSLCVCSLNAASYGIQLTAAANVAFLELDWTAATHERAEGRLHGLGQKRAVTAWYLLAATTIDERLARLLDRARKPAHEESDDPGLVDQLVSDLLTLPRPQ